MSEEDYVCAIDIGTSAIRGAIMTGTCVAIATEFRRRPDTGSATFSAARLVEDTFDVLKALTYAVDASRVTAVGLSGHVGTVFVDDAGEPIGPASMWSDARGIELTRELLECGPDADAIGRSLPAAGALALAMWMRSEAPERHRAIRWILTPKDYVSLRLTGTARTDVTSAAYSLAFDVRLAQWSPTLLAAAGLNTDQMPEALASSGIVGGITHAAAEATGLRAGTPVAAGGPDGTLGAAAVIGTSPEVIMDVAGTTDVLVRVSGGPSLNTPGAVVNPYVVPGSWSYGGPTGLTGEAVTQMARVLGYCRFSDAMSEMEAVNETDFSSPAPPLVMPHFSGSRFPTWNPAELGAVIGLRPEHSRIDVFRGVLEGAAFAVRQGVDLIAPEHEVPMAFAGGAARSRYLAQLRADCLERTVLACQEPDVSLRGAALTAMIAAGRHTTFDSAVRTMKPAVAVYQPQPAPSSQLATRYASWSDARQHAITYA